MHIDVSISSPLSALLGALLGGQRVALRRNLHSAHRGRDREARMAASVPDAVAFAKRSGRDPETKSGAIGAKAKVTIPPPPSSSRGPQGLRSKVLPLPPGALLPSNVIS